MYGKQVPGLARNMGVASVIGELVDPNVQDALDPSSDLTPGDRLRQAARSGLRVAGGIGGGVLGGTIGGVGTFTGPIGATAGGIVGGGIGYKAGDALGNYIFGPEAPARVRAAPVSTGQTQSGSIPEPTRPGMTVADATGSMPVDPRDYARGATTADGRQIGGYTGMGTSTMPAFIKVGKKPTAEGLGPNEEVVDNRPTVQFEVPDGGYLFHNDQTGEVTASQLKNPRIAQMLELNRMQAARAAEEEVRARYGGASSGGSSKLRGPFGDIVKLGQAGIDSRRQMNRANYDLRKQANDINLAKTAAELGFKDRELKVKEADAGLKRNEQGKKDLKDEVNTIATDLEQPQDTGGFFGTTVGQEKPEDYKNRVARRAAQIEKDINYTLGDRKTGKKTMGELDATDRQLLYLGHKLKSKLTDSRGELISKARDYFGNKRFDTGNLDSYLPAGVEDSIIPFQGGYTIKLRNGNTMTVKQARGGGFNLTGPSDPVDADVQALITPLINAYEAKQRQKGK